MGAASQRGLYRGHTLKFAYRRYLVRTDNDRRIVTVHRPLVPIRVFGPGGSAAILGLLDTDATLLPAFLIEQLAIEIDPRLTSRFRGVGGQTVSVVQGQVDLQIQSKRSIDRWSAAVGFIEGRTVAILGHAGVLERYEAKFDGARKEVTLKRITSQEC